jgi:hypothetical protein
MSYDDYHIHVAKWPTRQKWQVDVELNDGSVRTVECDDEAEALLLASTPVHIGQLLNWEDVDDLPLDFQETCEKLCKVLERHNLQDLTPYGRLMMVVRGKCDD